MSGIVQNSYYRDILAYDQLPSDTPAAICALNKVLGLGVYLGVLLVLLKRNRGADITWDLVALSLVTLLIAPFTWRHYYVLELLPLMFVWFLLRQGRFSNRTLWVAVACTLVASTRYPDYLQTHLTNGPLRVFLVGMLPLSALILLMTLLFAYQSEPGAGASTATPVET